jgi:hypothetical protein
MIPHWQRASAWLSYAAIATMCSGCQLVTNRPAAGETRVAQGKIYQSDNPTYDEFFEDVHAVQAQTTDAPDEEAKARAPLEEALGTRHTTPERLVELTKQRVTAKAGRDGPLVHVEVTGLESLDKDGERAKNVVVSVTVPDEAAIPSSHRGLVKALQESTKSEAEIVDKYAPVSAKARRLLVRREQLAASANRDFSTASRRNEVLHELEASKSALSAAADRAEKASSSARAMLKGMAEALPAHPEAVARVKEEKAAPGKASAPAKGAPLPAKSAKSPPAASSKPRPEARRKTPSEPRAQKLERAPKPQDPSPPAPNPATEDFNP